MRQDDLIAVAERAWNQLSGDGGVMDLSLLAQIGQGGSYRIFRIPDADGLVVKLPYQDYAFPFVVDQLNRDYARLHAALPTVSTPHRAYIARYRWSDEEPIITSHAIFQPFDPWIRTEHTRSLNMHYLEPNLTPDRLDAYHRLNDDLLGSGGSWRDAPTWLPCLKVVDELEAGQPGLVGAITRLLPTLAGLMDELDQLIDLVGDFNLYARHDASSGWNLCAGSVIKYNRMSRVRELLSTFPDHRIGVESLDAVDRCLLMNGIAIIRLINALALRGGIPAPFAGILQPAQRRALAYLRFGNTVASYP